ncbi:MAG: hypothetical protein LBC74_02870, partial [Planctomycetaceae bacterium]|nr:hypothetical protein [Planctomycetaceae bacterium]
MSLLLFIHLYRQRIRSIRSLLREKDDVIRRWIHWAKTDNPKTLYDPYYGYRRQAEWDDHG